MGSAPQQVRRASGVEEVAEARLTSHTGAARSCGRPLKSRCTTVGGGGLPPSSPDGGAPDSDGYSTVSETPGCQHRYRGHRGSREKKQLAPTRLDMPIFKSTDPGAEVMHMLWCFDVDAFLEKYDGASMRPHIFASLRGYPGKWACTLDESKDISVRDLLMHMEKTFSNKHDYDAMIRTLYEVQQREDETVEEYTLHIHDVVAVICHTYPEQARPILDTLYTLTKKLEVRQLVHTHQYTSSSEMYREKHRHYPVLACQVSALEEEGLVSTDPVTGEDSKSKVEVVGGLNVHLAQVMSCYQREEQKCFVCGSPGHFSETAPTAMLLGDGTRSRQTPKGQGKAARLPLDQRIPNLR